MEQSTLTLDQRRDILEQAIAKYVKRGYRVTARTDTTAQLLRPKKFSLLWALAWFLLFGIGILVYLIYYWSKRDDTVYLEVDSAGRVKRR